MTSSVRQQGVPRGQKKNTQGLAFIMFNSYGATDRLSGTGADMNNWIDALTELKFDWRLERNGTKDDMECFIKSAKTTPVDQDSGYVLFVYSGHGSADSIVSQDNEDLPLKKFLEPLYEGTMAAKTKLIFLDACRTISGKKLQNAEFETTMEFIIPPGENKTFIFFATHLGGSADDEPEGSVFSRKASEYILRPYSVKQMGDALMSVLGSHANYEYPRFYSFVKGDNPTLSTAWKKLARPPAASDQPPPPPSYHIKLYEDINVVNVLKRFGEGKFLVAISSVRFTVEEVKAMERMDVFNSDITQRLIAKDPNGKHKSSHARRQLLAAYFSGCLPGSAATTNQLVNFAIFVMKSLYYQDANKDLHTDILSAIDSVSKEPTRPVTVEIAVQTEEEELQPGQPKEEPIAKDPEPPI